MNTHPERGDKVEHARRDAIDGHHRTSTRAVIDGWRIAIAPAATLNSPSTSGTHSQAYHGNDGGRQGGNTRGVLTAGRRQNGVFHIAQSSRCSAWTCCFQLSPYSRM